MNQFRLGNFQERKEVGKGQNLLVLKSSTKQNMESPRNCRNSRDNFKGFQKGIDLQSLQKSIKSYEETLNKQKSSIQQLKQQLQANKSYTIALQQKYTILLESIQPFEEKINIQRLVEKIAQFENKFQLVQKAQNDSTSFRFLKLTQATSIQTGQIQSSTTFQEQSEISLQVLQASQSPVRLRSNTHSTLNNSENLVRKQIVVTVISSSQKQEKSRKQSTDSDIGIQVCLNEQFNAPIKKNHLQKYISFENQIKNNEINLSRKRKNSQFQENLSSLWQKIINEYLKSDQNLTTKFKFKTQHLLKKCIPYQLRSTVWPMIFENPLGITWQFYMELLQRRQKGWIQESVKIQIQKDLSRSFTGKGKQLENKDKLIDQVRQVLQLFHIYRPDVSYVQGMTYPAIVLTTVVGKMKAFCILANQVIGTPLFRRLYTFEGLYPSIYCRTFDYLLRDANSNAADMLQRKHINSQVFLIEWFYTFFSRGLSFQMILKIWDHFAYFGQMVIFKVAVSVIQLVVGFLTDATYEGAMGLIKQFSSYIDQKKLMQAINTSKVTQQRYKKAFRKAVKSFNSS